MKKLFCTLAAVSLMVPAFAEDVPPPDRLLPADTLGLLTVPDMTTARRLNTKSSHMLLWADPSLKAFKDKFLNKLDVEIIKPFEQKTGIELTNYLSLAQGQFTVAITRNGWNGAPGTAPGVVVLIDSRNESARMKSAVDDLLKRWRENGNSMKTETIRGVPFSVLLIPRDKLDEFDPTNAGGDDGSVEDPSPAADADDQEEVKPVELFVGQSGSLFLASTARTDLEKILSLQFGGPVMSLAESTSFMPDYNRSFRDAVVYGWLNFQPVAEAVQNSLPTADPGNPFAFNPQKVFRATGISGIRTIAMASSMQTDGDHFDFSVNVPESERRGLFRLLTFEAKDSAPPAFVPQDAVNFVRYRLNMMKSWNALEAMIAEISPQVGGMMKMTLEAVGKDKDATFDFRRMFVQNLGDDLISWRKLPRENTLESMKSQPEIVLIGSPNADQLSGALKTLVGMAPPDLTKMEEREFLGRKVWLIAIPTGMPAEGQTELPTQTIAFSSNSGYLAVASDVGLLEEFLRSSDGGPEPLINKTGLRFASEKTGGMNTGLYGYSNDRETMRYLYKFFTSDNAGQSVGMSGLNQFLSAMGANEDDSDFDEWVDFSLLPPFGQIEKHFDYTVYSGSVKPDGYFLQMFAPRPRGL